MEHSRLLKYILPEGYNYKTKMADPVKIKIEYENPNNIEAEVPEAQKIRISVNNENGESELITQNTIRINKEYTEEELEDGQLIRKHQITSNTNGEDKYDVRKIKTKIPVSRFRETVEKVKVERRESKEKEHESQIPIRRSSIPKLAINKTAPIKPVRKTIAVTQTTQKVSQTTVPEDEFDKLYEEVVCSTPTPVNIDISLLNPKVDDPENVENTFEEIIHNYDDNKVEPINVEKIRKSKIPFLKRKSQQEIEVQGDRSSKIIAARDKLKIRYSLTKPDEKKYEKEEETIKIIDDVNDKRDENHPTPKTELKSQYTKTITTSSKGNEEDNSTKLISTTMITEVKTIESSDKIEHKKGQIIEENIYKDCIKVGIPVFDSYIHEYTEKSKIEETVAVKRALSYTSNNGDFDVDKPKSEIKITQIYNENKPTIVEKGNNTEPKMFEIIDISENSFGSLKPELSTEKKRELDDTKKVLKEKDGSIEDLTKFRGKVGKLISKIDSHDPVDKEAHKVNFDKGLAKNKSVMSRIAMFERHEEEPVAKSKIPRKDTKFSKLLTSDTQRSEHAHIHTPLIVDEVFKPFQAITNTSNNDVVTTNGVERNPIEIVRDEMVIIESPETVHYDVKNKVPIESNTVFIEQSKVAEEVLTPVSRKFDTNENDVKDVFVDTKLDISVLVPKFIPVREVLKKYESLNDHEVHPSNKTIEDLPKKRPISEIISDLTPEVNYRSLDAMFAHQVRPISEILNDLNPQEIHKDEIENNVFVTQQSDIKYEFKVDDSTNKVFESTAIEATNDTSKSVNTTQHDFKSFKTSDIEFKTLESRDDNFKSLQFIQDYVKSKDDDLKRAKSVAELDLGDAVKGKVHRMIVRMNSVDKNELVTKEVPINIKELPRKRSVSEKIALFERKLTPAKEVLPPRITKQETQPKQSKEMPVTQEVKKPEILTVQQEELTAQTNLTADIQEKINQLSNAKLKYGKMEMPRIELANGMMMPVLAVGTALLDPRLAYHIVGAAIDLGYRAIDTAYIYGNEKVIGEAIRAKINDGTVKREELFIISKLWSTFHRTDLVKVACEASLEAMGLDYFDLYLIHNPMSFKEGGSPIPQIATVLQYSEFDYLDAWYGMETLGSKAKALGVSNFNSAQLQRVIDRARVKPVINQVECHPYLSQQRLDSFCSERNITLSCFGVLGSKGTPSNLKSGQPPVIDDALVKVMASGLNVSPAQLLIRYQIECGHNVVVKTSSAARLWDNLQALTFNLTSGQVDAMHAMNRNKRNFNFKGMGDTHKNYPFNTAF